jgi:hypothetical protein
MIEALNKIVTALTDQNVSLLGVLILFFFFYIIVLTVTKKNQ